MSLIQSAKLNRLDPYAYLRDVLERLPTQPANRIAELLPHRWRSENQDHAGPFQSLHHVQLTACRSPPLNTKS